MKKILILNWRDPYDPKSGGAEIVTLKHAKAWLQAGYSVTWVAGSYPGAKASEETEGIQYYRYLNSQVLFLVYWYLYWFKFKGDFDIVVDEIHGIPAFSPLWATRSKKVAFIHEVAGDIWFEMFRFPTSHIGRFVEKYIFPYLYRNTQFWVDSKSTMTDLMQLGIIKRNIEVIPCAIDQNQFVTKSKNSQLTLIFVARLVPMKGLHYALAVFKVILKKHPEAKLYVLGSGNNEYLEKVKTDFSSILNHVQFFGFVSEKKKYELLRKAHFLIHTSIKEGFGLTVLEANSQKTPAAIFDIHSLRDLVDNTTGITAPFPDTQSLAKQIVKVYASKKIYATMSSNCYKHSKQYNWEQITSRSKSLLEELK